MKSQSRNNRFGLECGLSSVAAENEEARGQYPLFLFHTEWPCLSVLSSIVALVHDSSVLRNTVLDLELQGAPRSVCLIWWPFRLLTMWNVGGGNPTNYLCLKPVTSHHSGDLAQWLVCWHKKLLWEKGLPACLGLRDRVKRIHGFAANPGIFAGVLVCSWEQAFPGEKCKQDLRIT